MADLAKLVVKMEADSARLQTDLDRVNKKFKRMGRQGNWAVKQIKKSFTSLGAVLGGAMFVSIEKAALKSGDQILKLSQRLGVSTEALSQLKFAGELSGIAFQTLSMGLQRMTRRIAEAANGTGEAVGALNELGLSAKKLKTLTPDQQLEILADKFIKVKTHADKVRLSMKLFDSEGVAFLQMMTDGADGIRAMREEADRLGATLTKLEAQQMAGVEDAVTRMNTAVSSLNKTLLIELSPNLERAGNYLANLAKSDPDAGGTKTSAFVDTVKSISQAVHVLDAEFYRFTAMQASFLGFDTIAAGLTEWSENAEKAGKQTAKLRELLLQTDVAASSLEKTQKKLSKSLSTELADGATKSINKMNEAVKRSASLLKRLSKEQESLTNEFQKRADNVGAAAPKDASKLSLIDTSQTITQARSAIAAGDFSGGINKLREAFDILDKMKGAGAESNIVLRGVAKQLQQLGEKAGMGRFDEAQAKIAIDIEAAKNAASEATKAMQAVLDAKPLVQKVTIQQVLSDPTGAATTSIPSSSLPAAASDNSKSPPNLQPVTINIPGVGEQNVYGDPGSIGQMQRDIARQRLKSGTK